MKIYIYIYIINNTIIVGVGEWTFVIMSNPFIKRKRLFHLKNQ
jgi:hypothetical protein